jgi:hypothetical protein
MTEDELKRPRDDGDSSTRVNEDRNSLVRVNYEYRQRSVAVITKFPANRRRSSSDPREPELCESPLVESEYELHRKLNDPRIAR